MEDEHMLVKAVDVLLEVFLHVHFKPGNLQSQETRRFFHLADLLT